MQPEVIATTEIVNQYWQRFVNRKAYTVQSFKPHPESGRHYYFRPTTKAEKRPLTLDQDTVRGRTGRRHHHRALCDQSKEPAMQVGCDRRRLQECHAGPAQAAVPPLGIRTG